MNKEGETGDGEVHHKSLPDALQVYCGKHPLVLAAEVGRGILGKGMGGGEVAAAQGIHRSARHWFSLCSSCLCGARESARVNSYGLVGGNGCGAGELLLDFGFTQSL